MAKNLTTKNNQIAPAGYITLVKPIVVRGKAYNKVWAPLWDIVIKDVKLEETPDAEKPENWLWHAVWKERVVYWADGANIVNFKKGIIPKGQEEEILIPGNLLKDIKKMIEDLKEGEEPKEDE